jgi:hypothetical protein
VAHEGKEFGRYQNTLGQKGRLSFTILRGNGCPVEEWEQLRLIFRGSIKFDGLHRCSFGLDIWQDWRGQGHLMRKISLHPFLDRKLLILGEDSEPRPHACVDECDHTDASG